MSYEHCEKHDCDATNGCGLCELDKEVADMQHPKSHLTEMLSELQALQHKSISDLQAAFLLTPQDVRGLICRQLDFNATVLALLTQLCERQKRT